MIPSYRWFPTNLQARVAWFLNFAVQFTKIAASLGMTAKVPQVEDDNDVMQFLGDTENQINAFLEAFRQYRKIITENPVGTPIPQFPANPAFALPKVIDTGVFARLDKLVGQIREADEYTDEIGALLGILPQGGTTDAAEPAPPKLKAATLPAQQIEVDFMRGKTDGVNLEMQVDGGSWTDKGNFYKSPALLTVTVEPSKPHSVNLRGRYLDGNSPAGQYSDIVAVVTQT